MRPGIIGGSLLKQLTELENVREEEVRTPFGKPSDKLITAELDGTEVVFLNRHGFSHHIAPHQVNYQANMFALKVLDVSHVIAVTAVGGITAQMSPMRWVLPDQIIDYTHGRIQTFNDGDQTQVNHIDFSYPFDQGLIHALAAVMSEQYCDYVSGGTYGVTQGPRLETVAEIARMERDGCDIVGMTAMPEAALARELEIDYAMMSLVVNRAAGKGEADSVIAMDDIRQRIEQGNRVAEQIITGFVSSLSV